MDTTTKKFTVWYGILTGFAGGIFVLSIFNYWEGRFPVNTGYLYPPLISLIIFLTGLLLLEKGITAKEKMIRISIFIPLHLVILYGTLISLVIFALSQAARSGAIF